MALILVIVTLIRGLVAVVVLSWAGGRAILALMVVCVTMIVRLVTGVVGIVVLMSFANLPKSETTWGDAAFQQFDRKTNGLLGTQYHA